MRPNMLFVLLMCWGCTGNNARQDTIPSKGTLKTSVSSRKNFDTTLTGESNQLNATTFRLGRLPKISSDKMTLVSSGQLSPSQTIKLEGCDFNLVTSAQDTSYLATSNERFRTPEGYKVGSKFSELPIDLQENLKKEPGWGYSYKLPSGWSLGFCEGSSCTDSYPRKSSKVKWIFKRR